MPGLAASPHKLVLSLVLSGLLLGTTARAADGDVTSDPRLQTVRARIEHTLEQTRREGLPADVVNSKIREGLAKGAPPDAIAAAAERLSGNLAEATRFLRTHRGGERSTMLLRVVAEARAAGADLDKAAVLVHPQTPEPQALRAVGVLTELARRGYPAGEAAMLIREVNERDPKSVSRLPAGLEAVRNTRGMSRAEAVELVRTGVAGGAATLDAALSNSRAADVQQDHGNHLGAAKKDKTKK